MDIYTIYKAYNKITGKIYIGFDSKWPRRKNAHKCYHKKRDNKFYRAIKKYGWENFEWSIVYQSLDKNHTKNIMETFFINEYDSFKNGYNSTFGGEGTFGISRKSQKVPYNHNGWVGKRHTEETKKLMSKSMTGVKRKDFNQKGGLNNNAKKISTPYGIFNSIKEASEIINIHYQKVWKQLQNNEDWFYI